MDTRSIGGHVLYYEDGEVIFKENTIGHEMYIIESGRVEISQRIGARKATIAMLVRGDFFGETAIFIDAPRTVTAMAVGRTTLMSFAMEEILQHMQTNLEFTITLLRALMNRLRDTTSTLKTLIARVYGFSDEFMDGLLPEKQPVKVGEILIEMDCLTKLQLERAIQKQKEAHMLEYRHKLLGEIMVECEIVTDEQLRSALTEQRMRLRRGFSIVNPSSPESQT